MIVRSLPYIISILILKHISLDAIYVSILTHFGVLSNMDSDKSR